jgi:hypothetical protein
MPKPSSDHWLVRGLWIAALVAAFASPTLFLRQMPLGIEKMTTTAVVTVLFVSVTGALASWRWLPKGRPRVVAVALWWVAAVLATTAVAAAGRWDWLDYTTGAASSVLGVAAFALLERGSAGAFRPRPRGFVHGALGLPPAYLPLGTLWAWTRL